MELLSPAGNLELAMAAFDGGADAVYCGLSRFNARERAENFTCETLGKAIRFAHENGKKVYVTLNTIIKEDELGAVFEILCELVKLHPDALIVQDLGVAGVVRRYFPELTLHASTQMGIHNSAGVAAAAAMGFRRVILERQITLPEIKEIAAEAKIELELFIHGSLCCSLSGRCLLSGSTGGFSGNRGKCKQPCRRFYRTDSGESGFLLSPRDLRGTALLEEFKKIKIASLKIEGRLRTPDYVWKTARAYRLLLDENKPSAECVAEAERLLASAISRRPSLGFYDFSGNAALIDSGNPGSFGRTVGKVNKVLRRSLAVTTLAPLHLGDRLRLAPAGGGDGETFSLVSMERVNGEKPLRVRANEKIFIPGERKAAAGWTLSKIGENGFDYSRRASALPGQRQQLDISLQCSATYWKGEIAGVPAWEKRVAFSNAEKRYFQSSDVERCFAEAVPHPWMAGRIRVNIAGKFFVPASELKKLRREFWEYMETFLSLDEYFSFLPERMENFYVECHTESRERILPEVETDLDIPPFIPETELAVWRKRITAAYDSGARRFGVSALHSFELLKEYGDIKLISRFPLIAANSRAIRQLAELGCCAAESSPELDMCAIYAMAKYSSLPLFQSRDPLPLLVTRVPLVQGVWHDEAGHVFNVKRAGNTTMLSGGGGSDPRSYFRENILK